MRLNLTDKCGYALLISKQIKKHSQEPERFFKKLESECQMMMKYG